MANSKHTAGPWNADNLGRYVIQPARNELVCDLAKHKPGRADRRPFDSQRLANARLIAAAPDLLEALRASAHALSVLSGKATETTKARITATSIQAGLPLGQVELEQARAAIAKAIQD